MFTIKLCRFFSGDFFCMVHMTVLTLIWKFKYESLIWKKVWYEKRYLTWICYLTWRYLTWRYLTWRYLTWRHKRYLTWRYESLIWKKEHTKVYDWLINYNLECKSITKAHDIVLGTIVQAFMYSVVSSLRVFGKSLAGEYSIINSRKSAKLMMEAAKEWSIHGV